MNNIKVPDEPKELMQILLDAGYEAYVVGGCIRDSLLGLEPHDWDICTSALPEQMKECFKDYNVIETDLKHGTLTVVLNHTPYEITTFRKETDYTDHRHPDTVEFVTDLAIDLGQRDFTVNAMAADVSGKIIDHYGCVFDLQNTILRCVGNPYDRFQEDALRILRAMRFISKYGFGIHGETDKAMRKCKYLLKEISAERINHELSEILLGDYCYSVLIGCSDILSVIIPEISKSIGFDQHSPYHDKTVWGHTVSAIHAAPKDLYIRLALLYHDLGKPYCFSLKDDIGHFYGHAVVGGSIAENSLRKLKYDSKTIENVTQLVELHDMTIAITKKSIRRYLNRLGKEQFLRLVEVKAADLSVHNGVEKCRDFDKYEIYAIVGEIERQQECFSLKDLAVNGNDLISIGYETGKSLGNCLQTLLNDVMNDIIPNNKSALLAEAEKMLKQSAADSI